MDLEPWVYWSVRKPTKKDDTQDKVYNKRKRQRIISKGVEIYTTSWCKYCKKAIAFLKSNRVKFRQYDIEKDLNAAKRMKALGGTGGVPFALINGKSVYGFTPDRYRQALGLRWWCTGYWKRRRPLNYKFFLVTATNIIILWASCKPHEKNWLNAIAVHIGSLG